MKLEVKPFEWSGKLPLFTHGDRRSESGEKAYRATQWLRGECLQAPPFRGIHFGGWAVVSWACTGRAVSDQAEPERGFMAGTTGKVSYRTIGGSSSVPQQVQAPGDSPSYESGQNAGGCSGRKWTVPATEMDKTPITVDGGWGRGPKREAYNCQGDIQRPNIEREEVPRPQRQGTI